MSYSKKGKEHTRDRKGTGQALVGHLPDFQSLGEEHSMRCSAEAGPGEDEVVAKVVSRK